MTKASLREGEVRDNRLRALRAGERGVDSAAVGNQQNEPDVDINPRCGQQGCLRGTSLIRNSAPLGPCSRTIPRALWWVLGRGCFL